MQGYSSALVLFGDSISRIRELENFLLHAMENVDIRIELVRIREFDGSGGRIELYCALVPLYLLCLPLFYNLSRSGKEWKGVYSLSLSYEILSCLLWL